MTFLSGCGFPVSLTTTSERFSDPGFLESVLKVFPAARLSATTALHSFDPGIHDAMTMTAGSFHRWSEGLLALEKAGVGITLKHLLCRPTIKSLTAFVEEYYSRFTSTTGLYLCALDFSGMAEKNMNRLFCSFAELRENLEPALDIVTAYQAKGDRRRVSVLDLPPCAVRGPYRHFFLGTRHANSELAFYDAPDYDKNAPRDNLIQQHSILPEICSPCIYRDTCQGTWTTAVKCYAEKDFHPVLRRGSCD